MDYQSLYDSAATYLRYLWWGGDPDHVNETSGLTLREIYAVQKSWAAIHAQAEKYGMELFKRLFRADPETKSFFSSFRNFSEAQLATNYQFKAHVINFMASLNQAVTHLKNPEVVIIMANKVGVSHGGRHVQRRHFYVVRDVFVSFLKELKQSDEVITAWAKFVDFFYQHIFDTLGDYDKT